MANYVGDIPVADLVIEPAFDLEPFEHAGEIAVTSPTALVDSTGFLVTVDADAGQVVIEWPGDLVLDEAGVWTLAVTLVTSDERRQRLAPVHVIVQAENGWYTLDGAREDWTDAPEADARLEQLLELAQQQVLAYAPALADGARVPANYKAGQLMQARNLWNAGLVDPATGQQGDDTGFQLRPFPLDWMVRQILRPKTGVPKVG